MSSTPPDDPPQRPDEGSPTAGRSRRVPRQTHRLVGTVLLLAAVAIMAQLAGVVASRPASTSPKDARPLAYIPAVPVPDRASTVLATKQVRVERGRTLRMSTTATLSRLGARDGLARVTCGIQYDRADDPTWTLGVPYQATELEAGDRTRTVRITRTVIAPATDTYRLRLACHVAHRVGGARIAARGTVSATSSSRPTTMVPAAGGGNGRVAGTG